MADIFELLKKLRAGSADAPSAGVEWIIAGLGNPGTEYEKTRHNAGFLCAGELAKRCGVEINRLKFKALTARCEISCRGVLILCPLTYMNCSGESVKAAADYYRVPPSRILVICDDIYRDVGRLKIKRKGTDGGHRGLENIIYLLGSDEFPRIRIGVGAKPEGWDLADWVLSRFTDDEIAGLIAGIDLACEGIPLIIGGKTEEAMQKCNR